MVKCKMSLRPRVVSAQSDETRLRKVLQIGVTMRTFKQKDREMVFAKNAELSEMREVLETAIRASLELIRGREIGRDHTTINIEATDPNVTFDIAVHLEHGGSKVLVRGVIGKVNMTPDPYKPPDTREETILTMADAMVKMSGAKEFSVTYYRKLDEE